MITIDIDDTYFKDELAKTVVETFANMIVDITKNNEKIEFKINSDLDEKIRDKVNDIIKEKSQQSNFNADRKEKLLAKWSPVLNNNNRTKEEKFKEAIILESQETWTPIVNKWMPMLKYTDDKNEAIPKELWGNCAIILEEIEKYAQEELAKQYTKPYDLICTAKVGACMVGVRHTFILVMKDTSIQNKIEFYKQKCDEIINSKWSVEFEDDLKNTADIDIKAELINAIIQDIIREIKK